MDSTRGTQVPHESNNHEQNQIDNIVPFEFVTIGNNSDSNAGGDDGNGDDNGGVIRVVTLGNISVGTNAPNTGGAAAGNGGDQCVPHFGASLIFVEPNEDIIEVLSEMAEEKEVFVLMAQGYLSHIELCNSQVAPVANTVLEGMFMINTLEGNLVMSGENEGNIEGCMDAVVTGADGKLMGGPVRKLICYSRVQVMVSTMSRSGLVEWARDAYNATAEFSDEAQPHINFDDFMPTRDHILQIYDNTLEEIN